MSPSWLLTLFGLVLSVLGTVIILRWPTYVTPIMQDKRTKKWVRLGAWTHGELVPKWEIAIAQIGPFLLILGLALQVAAFVLTAQHSQCL
jgi:hypothetical protein